MVGRRRRVPGPAGFDVCDSVDTVKENGMGWMTGFDGLEPYPSKTNAFPERTYKEL